VKRRNFSQRDLNARLSSWLTTLVNAWRATFNETRRPPSARYTSSVGVLYRRFIYTHLRSFAFFIFNNFVEEGRKRGQQNASAISGSRCAQFICIRADPTDGRWLLRSFCQSAQSQSLTTSNCPAWPVGAIKSERDQTTRRAPSGSARCSLSPRETQLHLFYTEKNRLIVPTRRIWLKAFWLNQTRISSYHDKTRFFITRTFNRFYYKDLVSIFWLDL